MGILDARTTVLLAAAGAPWEAGVVSALSRSSVVVGKRCVDVTDLLATAATGVADVVVVAADLPGLDADAVRRITESHTAILAVADRDGVERVRRRGVAEVLVDPEADEVATAVVEQAARQRDQPQAPDTPVGAAPATVALNDGADTPGSTDGGLVVVVWGPTGAPGRTTVAAGIAAERAARGHRVVLVDADPYGGAVGQNLGILDEVSGLLAASRHVNEGTLAPDALARCRRSLPTGLEVLTGLPRAERWGEVRPGALEQVIAMSALHADVVVDIGFGLVEDRHQGRDRISLEALDAADVVVAVGGAEPVGLVRLARGLVDLGERGTTPDHVVINRMRDSLGWTRKELVGMVTGYVWDAGVHFVRDERDTLDRALASGRSVSELGDSRLRADVAAVASAAFGS